MDPILLVILIAVALAIATAVVLARARRDVPEGQALIILRLKGDPQVSFKPVLVLPFVQRAETIDITLKRIDIVREGKEGIICRDNIRADVRASFYVKVNKTEQDILKVAQSVGAARASRAETLEDLFAPRFSEAIKTVFKQLQFDELFESRDMARDQVLQVIGMDLNGFALEDLALDHIEQTPVEHLDPRNILDAEGIRKITDIASHKAIETNRIENEQRVQLKRQDLDAQRAIMELDRARAEAEAASAREIAIIRATEEARTLEARAQIEGLPASEVEGLAKAREEAIRRLLEENRARTQALLKG